MVRNFKRVTKMASLVYEREIATATAARTAQNNRFNKRKQCVCTCLLHLGKFFLLFPAKQQRQTPKLEQLQIRPFF